MVLVRVTDRFCYITNITICPRAGENMRKMLKKIDAADNTVDQETINRFIIRARRVEAHSLVKSGDIERYAIPKMTMHISETGETGVQHHICANEEAIESLASRLRPFIVKSESIYLSKVFDAIDSQVPIDDRTPEEEGVLEHAKSWFKHRHESKDSKRYGIQLLDRDGTPQTGLLDDALLAESWIYTDTVHADPKGDKAAAQKLSYFERYRAGSSFFCEFASVIVSLLNLVRTLSEKGQIKVPEAIWSEPITYEDIVEATEDQATGSTVYVFPAGTVIPPNTDPKDIPGATRLTPKLMQKLESHPENIAYITILDAEKKQTGRYLAFCESAENSLRFLVDEIGTLTIRVGEPLQTGIPIESIMFSPVESATSKATEFVEAILSPNWIELEYALDGQTGKITLKITRNSE